MSILNRYIVIETCKYFCLTLISVLGLFIAIDYLGTMDEFIAAEITLWRAFQYVLYKTPFICSQAMPVVLLMSILIVFGLMSKNKELLAINAGGISIYALVKPVLLMCTAMALLLFLLAEQMVPVTMLHANAILFQEIRTSTKVSVNEKNIWIKGRRKITHIKFFDPASQAIFGFTQYQFDDRFRLVRRMDARKGEYHDGKWELADCMIQTLNQNGSYDIVLNHRRKEKLALHPEDFQQIVRRSTEMSFGELRSYVNKIESEGYDATVYKVDLYAKSAYPIVCIIMGLVGIGLTARKQLSSGIPLSVTYGLAIGFSFWIFQSFCISLGYGGRLPPLLAAWTANFIFLCGGFFLVLHAE